MENNNLSNSVSKQKSYFEKISFLTGITGSAITIALTIWNTRVQKEIQTTQNNLKALEISLQTRQTGIEESKERVDRYKWVLSVFPSLNTSDKNQRVFSLNLVRLALTKSEAEQLFTGLQTSSDSTLQSIGKTGIAAIQNEPIANLISQMNAGNAATRRATVAKLVRDYKYSTQAISLTLKLYDKKNINSLSPSGIINGLYFLSATDIDSWNKQQISDALDILNRLNLSNQGPQTKAAVNNLKERINQNKLQ